MQDDFEWVEEIREIAGRLNCLVNEDAIKSLLSLYLIEKNIDEKAKLRTEIEAILAPYIPSLTLSEKPMLSSPKPEKSVGVISLGRIVQGARFAADFYISHEDLQKHVAVFGATGSGKTTLILQILRQLMEQNIPFLFFDFKRDLRNVRDRRIWVLRWNWLRLNPLRPPPKVEKKVWMGIVSNIFSHVFGWFYASENYLLNFFDKAYSMSANSCPTLRDVYNLVLQSEESSRRTSEYRDVVLNRLSSILLILGEVVDCEDGFPIEELLNNYVVIELDGLRRDEANFLIEWLILWIFMYRIANEHRGKLRHVIIFDECNRIFYKSKQFKETSIELGIPFIETVPMMIRDYCEGLIFATQEPSITSHSVMANTNTKLVGYLTDGEDIECISRSLNLDDYETSAISKLEKGEWIVKKPGIKPFMLRSQDFPLEKNVTDEELKQRMSTVLERLEAMGKAHEREKEKLGHKSEESAKTRELSPYAKALLLDVNSHPFRGLSSRYKALNFSSRKGEQAKKELIQKGLVTEAQVKLGSFRPLKFLVPTREGLKTLEKMGQKTRLWEYIGYSGFEHRFYQVIITYSLRRCGYEVSIEKLVDNGVRADVLASKNGKRIGIEVELDARIDLNRLFVQMKNIDELWVVSKSLETLKGIKSKLMERLHPSLMQKIRFQLIEEYVSKIQAKGNTDFCGKKFSGWNKGG